MYLSSSMNNFPFQNIPPSWFVQRREHLETYYQELSILKDKVSRFASSQNVVAVLNAAEALNQLTRQIQNMEDHLESNLIERSEGFDFYNRGDLRRIRELSIATSTQLEAIAGEIGWGMSADTQISQVTRNLYPLLRLIQDTLRWLEQGINS
jgi:hypothetical protein